MDFINPYDESIPIHEREAWVEAQRHALLEDSQVVIQIQSRGDSDCSQTILQAMANVNSRSVTLAKAFKMLQRLGGRDWDKLPMPIFSEEGKIEYWGLSSNGTENRVKTRTLAQSAFQ